MATEEVKGEIVACPIKVDRKSRGWPGKEPVAPCGFSVAYLPGQWEEYPGGPSHSNADPAEGSLRYHIATHTLADFKATNG